MTSDNDNANWLDYLKAWPQYLWPGHLLSLGMLALTRIRFRPIREPFTQWFVKRFQVEMSEAIEPDPLKYEHFNAFFTRALVADARPLAEDNSTLVCPVDGTVSQAQAIDGDRIFQAKGQNYSLVELLGGSEERAEAFRGGQFATIYLSPRDYHRIHMPIDGSLKEMVHVPGRLFSVNPATTRAVPRLFARNERVVSIFDTELGPMAMVKVGAIFVAGIETVWHGLVTPPAGRIVRQWKYGEGNESPKLYRGDEMGRFNMGSTVIVLFGPGVVEWAQEISPGAPVRLGQTLASPCKSTENTDAAD